MHPNLGPEPLAEGFSLQFPDDVCANCGTRSEVFVAEQDTRVTRLLPLGGSSAAFALPVPTCLHCADSLSRPPMSWGGKLAITALLAGACAAVLTFAIPDGPGAGLAARHPWVVSSLVGLVLSWVWFRRHRAEAPQSSFYQPVRIRRLQRQRLGGTILALHFGFTNKAYRLAFARANREAIRAGHVGAADA
ncbi:hypothetical protein QRD43_02345 [Pelomonas sp. APW6]|uniref:Uncharacterized protein n=1 Tax=Roseateles subflavus TaxID=3053353 RepID=A0ABT7LEL2_9BURK|nr:hypothetical protein [Pelomonas sp. APW6]MDL5030732.1 hypothetical protein [Pelomonas sp. APW6]